ncbi:hypothetical protein SASPL_152891 [Salvia splendens]|uniref:Uncharacterized protein n=1 Tax=Salvia splendens TaxID=180675 RepID=A0A8X8W4J1_SALSN|nr:hypothetical protein SASPL_152891 [Salvia splendens]
MLKMQFPRHLLFQLSLLLVFSSLSSMADQSEPSIYEVLKLHGLPMGLLPKGINNFSLDDAGKFEVHLDRACNAKFENELHYDMNISGTLQFGQIDQLSGISAQDLFLWFPVIEIRVDIPSSGLIYFDVGVVSKQFSLSSFETPRDCLAVSEPDLQLGRQAVETFSKDSIVEQAGNAKGYTKAQSRRGFSILCRVFKVVVLPPVLIQTVQSQVGGVDGCWRKNQRYLHHCGGGEMNQIGASGFGNQVIYLPRFVNAKASHFTEKVRVDSHTVSFVVQKPFII